MKSGRTYVSPLFQKMMAYAQILEPRSIFILSAKYGLLSSDEMIEPYEQTLKNIKAADKRLWAQGVLAELRKASWDPSKPTTLYFSPEPPIARILFRI